MSATDWTRVRALLESAYDLPADQRLAFVARAASDDHALAAEVCALLAAEAGAGSFLAGTRVGPAAEVEAAPGEPSTRTAIGPWRVVGVLGRGGMGAVYLGERMAGDVTLRAAVKLVAGADRDDVLRRFRLERRILASLDHPGIARLLDGGTTDDGLPYFALEYVDGTSITTHVRERGLDLAARLDLFRRVADAVAFAHRRLVVHRDLKPANILVDATGAPKLLDFGIAKVLEDTDAASPATVTAQGWMTPAWASPEQLRGEPATTATDVYALGLLLYELLADVSAVPVGDPVAAARVRLEGGITRPSVAVGRTTGVGAARRAAALRGDLDTIVMKALAVEPARRYDSVSVLAAEIERYQQGRPILARPDTLGYRTSKFVRRHRWAVGFAAVAVAALVAGLALALRGQQQARAAEVEARTSAATAERVSGFMVGLFRIADPGESRGNAVTARELLDRGAAGIDGLTDAPEVQSRLRGTMAQAYGELGLYERQTALLEATLTGVRARRGVASAEALALQAQLAAAVTRRGDYARARDLAEQAVTGFDRLPSPPARELALALAQAGIGQWQTGDLPTAQARLERAAAVYDTLPEKDPRDHLRVVGNLAILHMQRDDVDRARPLYERALALAVEAYGPDAPAVAITHNNLAALELRADRPAAARDHHRTALAIRRRVLPAGHPDIAESVHNLGEAERQLGHLAEARQLTEEAWAARRARFGDEHVVPAASESNLGEILRQQGERAAGRPRFVHAIAVFERTLGPAHPTLAYALGGLGRLEQADGHLDRAEALMRRALAIRESKLGAAHGDTVRTRTELADVLRARGATAAADALLAAAR